MFRLNFTLGNAFTASTSYFLPRYVYLIRNGFSLWVND